MMVGSAEALQNWATEVYSVDDCWRVSKRYWARGTHSAQARSLAVHDYSNNNEKGKYEPQEVGSHYDFIFVN
jgi:hypothetical protein